MRKVKWFLWLLALPSLMVNDNAHPKCSFVDYSSGTYIVTKHDGFNASHELQMCGELEPWAEDIAEALNEAHERRSRYLKEIIPPHTGINKHDDYLGIYGESK